MLLKSTEVCKVICPFTKSGVLNLRPKDWLQGTQKFPDTECKLTHVFSSFWEGRLQLSSDMSKGSIIQRLRTTSPNKPDCSACLIGSVLVSPSQVVSGYFLLLVHCLGHAHLLLICCGLEKLVNELKKMCFN